MERDPSNLEGLRTSSTSNRPNGADRPTVARVTLGWSLIALVLLVGFAIGSRTGLADGSREPSKAAPANATPPVVSAAAPEYDSGRAMASLDAVESSAVSAMLDTGDSMDPLDPPGDLPGHSPVESDPGPQDAVQEESSPLREAESDYSVASFGNPISIEKLPIHRDAHSTAAPPSLTIVTRGEIRRGETLGSSLGRQGISASTVHLVATEMRKVFDFRRSRPGDEYRLSQDSDGRVLDFRYSQSSDESFYLSWNGTRYVVQKETAELRPQIAKIAGIVDSSFYGAVLALGEQSALASEFARILAWDLDFSRSVHPGDEFQILYERLYRRNDDGEDVYVRPGRIFAGLQNINI